MVQDGTFAYMNQYGRNDTVGELGSYDMTISGVNGSLQFFPNDFAFNDYQIVNIAYHLDDNVVALGLLLKSPLMLSKLTALLPKDSKKSVRILLAKIISSEYIAPAASKEFSATKSKL